MRVWGREFCGREQGLNCTSPSKIVIHWAFWFVFFLSQRICLGVLCWPMIVALRVATCQNTLCAILSTMNTTVFLGNFAWSSCSSDLNDLQFKMHSIHLQSVFGSLWMCGVHFESTLSALSLRSWFDNTFKFFGHWPLFLGYIWKE